jgi:hypothetical protein
VMQTVLFYFAKKTSEYKLQTGRKRTVAYTRGLKGVAVLVLYSLHAVHMITCLKLCVLLVGTD